MTTPDYPAIRELYEQAKVVRATMGPWGAAAAIVRQVPAILDDRERLLGLLGECRSYMDHHDNCAIRRGNGERPCDCGLRKARAVIDASLWKPSSGASDGNNAL